GQLLDRPAGHDLGLHPGHEHAGADLELQVAEVGQPGDVLERLTGRPAGDVVPEPGVEVDVGDQVQLTAGHSVQVGGDQLGVGAGRLHPGLGQPAGRYGDLVEQEGHFLVLPLLKDSVVVRAGDLV